MKVYLGGIGNESNWKEKFKESSKGTTIELIETGDRKNCDFILYVVTPKMKNVSAIVNVVNDSNHEKARTVFCTLNEEDGEEFTSHQDKSLVATGKMVQLNGGNWFTSIKETVEFITRNA